MYVPPLPLHVSLPIFFWPFDGKPKLCADAIAGMQVAISAVMRILFKSSSDEASWCLDWERCIKQLDRSSRQNALAQIGTSGRFIIAEPALTRAGIEIGRAHV